MPESGVRQPVDLETGMEPLTARHAAWALGAALVSAALVASGVTWILLRLLGPILAD